MGLNDETHFFQIGHFIADRRRGVIQIIHFGDRPGTHGFAGILIVLNDSQQYFPFSVVQFHDPSPYRVSTQTHRVLTSVYNITPSSVFVNGFMLFLWNIFSLFRISPA